MRADRKYTCICTDPLLHMKLTQGAHTLKQNCAVEAPAHTTTDLLQKGATAVPTKRERVVRKPKDANRKERQQEQGHISAEQMTLFLSQQSQHMSHIQKHLEATKKQ